MRNYIEHLFFKQRLPDSAGMALWKDVPGVRIHTPAPFPWKCLVSLG